jgi:hypothetical protein
MGYNKIYTATQNTTVGRATRKPDQHIAPHLQNHLRKSQETEISTRLQRAINNWKCLRTLGQRFNIKMYLFILY